MSPSALPTNTVSNLPLRLTPKANGNKTANTSSLHVEDGEKIDFVLRTFRCLIADLCEQFSGGHPG